MHGRSFFSKFFVLLILKLFSDSGKEKGRISEDFDREMEISNKVKEGHNKQTKIPLLTNQVSQRIVCHPEIYVSFCSNNTA